MADTAISSEIRNVLAEVLASPQFCTALDAAIAARVLSSSGSTPTVPTTVSASQSPLSSLSRRQSHSRLSVSTRIREMFPSIRNNMNAANGRNSRTTNTSRARPVHSTQFEREVILLKQNTCQETLKRNEKFIALRDGYAKPAVKFHTNWSLFAVKEHLRTIFRNKLGAIDFSLFIPISGFLSELEVDDEQSIGQKIKRLTLQKPVYLRPIHNLAEEENELLFETNDTDTLSVDSCFLNFNDENTNDQDESDLNVHETFVMALKTLNGEIKDEYSTPSYFNVNRERIFITCRVTLQRRNFDPFDRLSVNFVDFDEQTEGAIDGGGPSAEMFRLCLQYFKSSCLFEGSDISKNLTYYVDQVEQKNYFYCGTIIGMAILHGLNGPNFFSKLLFNYLVEGINNVKPQLDDLPYGKLKSILENILDCEDLCEIQNTIIEEDLISITGWSFIANINEKQKLIDDVLKFHLIHRIRPALEQFLEGLKSCKMHTLIHRFPSDMRELLCYTPTNLTFDKVKKMFHVTMSIQGSNQRTVENNVMANFYNFLVDCEANDAAITLEDILIFTTGCSDVPPLGFKHPPSLEFLHNTTKRYPEASTCALILRLPVIHESFENFKTDLAFGIKNGTVFEFE